MRELFDESLNTSKLPHLPTKEWREGEWRTMTCNYCGSRLGRGEYRCWKCGRRPDDTLSAEPATIGNLATQRRIILQVDPPRPPLHVEQPVNSGRPVQSQFVFPEGPVNKDRSGLRIVPSEGFAAKAVRKGQSGRTPRPADAIEMQGRLELLPQAPAKPRTLGTNVDAVIFCEAPVAARMHRAVAAAMDWAMVLLAYGAFLGVYAAFGGQFSLNRTTSMLFGADLAVVALVYGLTFALAGAVTPGMRWTRLRLLTFDGFPPDLKQRLARFVGSCLSVSTIIGLLWSLVDEESLTWQDHISRTFPTPEESGKDTLRRN